MKINVLENALSGINEKTLDSVLNERYKRMEKEETKTSIISTERKSFFFLKKSIAVAAVFTVTLCGLAIIVHLSTRNPGIVDDSHTAEPKLSETANIGSETPPNYIPAFSTPTLEEVYAMAPYSELLPKQLLSGCSFSHSYMTEYDPMVNPEGRKYLSLTFKTGDKHWDTMTIRVSEYDGNGMIADPNKPETYKLELYYGPIENEGAVGATLPNVFRIIRSTDVSREIASDRIYTFKDGLCKASIDILCDDYIVSYGYTGKEISGSLFYDCITSSLFFERTDHTEQIELSETANADSETPPDFFPAFSTPTLEEVYAMAPFSELLPKQLLSGCSFSDSYMTEDDPRINVEGWGYLSLTFKTRDKHWDTMEISVSKYDRSAIFADINDKKTYALSYLYGYLRGDAATMTEKIVFLIYSMQRILPLI